MNIPPTLRLVAPRAAGIWLVTRLALLVATLTSDWSSWHFWDATFYEHIATTGYDPHDHRLAAYFPLYPLLTHGVMLPGVEFNAAALVVSSLALLVALIAMGCLAWQESGRQDVALLVVGLLACLPLSFFLSAMYPDGLFIALAVLALYCVRTERWRLASLPLAAAIVTRPFGALLCLAVWVAYAAERRYRVSEAVALVGVPTLAFVTWALVLMIAYRDPLAFLHVEHTGFGHAFWWPWQTLALQAQEFIALPAWRAHMLLDIIPPFACLAVAIIMARRWPLVYIAYTLLVVVVCLTTPVTASGQYAMVSAGRYTFAAIPVLLACGDWLQRAPRLVAAAILAASFVLQIGLTVYVLHGGWIV
jgi:hypothetical protein